ncbi:MAG: HesA/MoeB/ThiF family protein [Gammaproteobacteria bacterium]|nr:MAG: HesA/MoeB/ThiF family protein [Gammaproteobacteria bacterium]
MDEKQLDRYSRQIRLPQIGEAGQQKILDASVLIIGMGGLGSPAALYLAAGGIGRLVISDYDVVEASNLQRQIIHTSASIGELKVDSAKRAIESLNPDCRVESVNYQIEGDELKSIIGGVDIVLDCSDNFPTRFEVNRNCVERETPLVSGAAIRLEGQIMNYQPGVGGPCYQCLYTQVYENAETCEMEGVLGPVVGVIGTMQALQTLLILTGRGEPLIGRLLLLDAANLEWQAVNLTKNPACPVCGTQA